MTRDPGGRDGIDGIARTLLVVLVCVLLSTQVVAVGTAGAVSAPDGAHPTERVETLSVTDERGQSVESVTGEVTGSQSIAAPDNDTNETSHRGPNHRNVRYGNGTPVEGSGVSQQSTASGDIEIEYVVDRMKGNSNMSVTAEVTLPSGVTSLTFYQFPSNAAVTGANGFTEEQDGDWKTNQSSANITYEMPFEFDPPRGLEGTDEGSWAFNGEPAYSLRYSYSYTDPPSGYEFTSRSASGNAVGNDFLFWGSRTVVDVSGTTGPLEVVAPDAASYSSAIADTLRSADNNFTVGHRPDLIRGFVAPDPIRGGGLTVGAVDSVRGFWVGEGSSPNSPNNVWVHEYVHTRQVFFTDTKARWFTEGSAEYFATYLTAEEGRIDFSTFHDDVTTDNYRSAVLSEPSDWSGTLANYEKGAHVAAALDAKIRSESGGSGSLEDAFATMNDDTGYLTLAEFKDAVEGAAGTSLDSWIDQYVTTSDIPSVPDDPAAFGFGSSKTTVQLELSATPSTVEAGEDVEFSVQRADNGNPVDAIVSVDGTSYSTGSDGSVVVSMGTVGTYNAEATKSDTGSETYQSDTATVTVEEADSAAFDVRDLSVSTPVVEGEEFTVSATVENVGQESGETTATFEVDGSARTDRSVQLNAGQSTTVSTTLSASAGEREIAVAADGNRTSQTITVNEAATFAVTDFVVPGSATQGDTVEVSGTIENTGGVSGNETVTYRFDRNGTGQFGDSGDVSRSTTVDLAAGTSTTVRFEVSLDGLSEGNYAHELATTNDSLRDSTTVSVPPKYELSGPSVPGTVPVNDSFQTSVEVQNVGPDRKEDELSLRLDVDGDGKFESGEEVGNETLYLSEGANVTIYVLGSSEGVPPGTYTYAFTSQYDRVTGTVTVQGETNGAPVADAGSNKTATAGETVTLDGSGSSDPDGDSLSYSWQQTGGPEVTISDADSETATLTVPEVDSETTLSFALVVDDGTATATDSVSVTVSPSATDSQVERSVDAEVTPGGSLSVTLDAHFAVAHDAVSIQDGYEGPIASGSVTSVTVDGDPVDPRVALVAKTGASVALEDVPADANVSVEYVLEVAEDASPGETVTFTGASGSDVAAGSFSGEFGTTTVAVVDGGPVERFDEDDDGKISTEELNAAIKTWATGGISTDALNAVIQTWVVS